MSATYWAWSNTMKKGLTAPSPTPDVEEQRSTRPERPRAWKRTNWGAVLSTVGVGVAIFLGFELVFRLGIIHELILPSPVDMVREGALQAVNGYMWEHLWVTTQEALGGFVLAAVLGVGAGVAIAMSRRVGRALYPYVILLQSMPRIALVPVFVAVFGFGMGTKVVTATVLAFFPPLINTIVGIQSADENAVLLMRSFCATRSQIFRRLLWPGALPAVFGGLKTALTLAFLGAFVGELTAANKGIAVLMETSAFELRMDALFAYLLWFSAISLTSFGALALTEKKLVHWREDARRDVLATENL